MTHDTTQNGTSRASAVPPPIHGLPAEGTPPAAGETGAGSKPGATTPSMSGEPHRARPIHLSSVDKVEADLRERRRDLLEQEEMTHREVMRARKLFPTNRRLLHALGEEHGELCRAFLNGEGKARIQAEARQVAAVALRIATEGDAEYGGFGVEPEDRARAAEEGDLFEEESAAPVMAAAREVPVVGTIGGASVPPAPEKVEMVAHPTSVMKMLWLLWPRLSRIRGKGPDEYRGAYRSSSELAKALERLAADQADALSLPADGLKADLLKSADDPHGELTGANVRKGLMRHLHEHAVMRNDPGSTTQWERRFQLVQESVGSRVLWSWREVTG